MISSFARGLDRRWVALIALTLLALVSGALLLGGIGFEAWYLGFLLISGFSLGSLGLLMLGHLLGEYWLNPVRAELEAAALVMPFTAALGIPLAFGLEILYPWAAAGFEAAIPQLRRDWFAPGFFLVRAAIYLIVWSILALAVTRPGQHRGLSAFGLSLLLPTATLAGTDWVMSRDIDWWSSAFGFAYAVRQMVPALAGAVLITMLRPEHPDDDRMRSLERALITLTLLTVWIWFSQYLVIWMANLPNEAAWYVRRKEAFGWLLLWIAFPATVLGVSLLVLLRPGGWLMMTACALLIVQHVVHMIWLIRPSPTGASFTVLDLPVVAVLVALWLLCFLVGLRERPNLAAHEAVQEREFSSKASPRQ